MLEYQGKQYKDFDELAKALKKSKAMANHLFHVNGGEVVKKKEKDSKDES